jgi:hypothetical protein
MSLDSVFTISAILGGTVLAFQFVLMLWGGADGVDVAGADGVDLSGGVDAGGVAAGGAEATWHEAADADLGHPGAHWFYEVISLRTLSAAITFFGLGGKAALAYGLHAMPSLVVAALAGLAALYGVYWLFQQVYKLQHSGNENVRNAIGLMATVYVPIAAKRAAAGKVTFRLQNRLVEYQAVTDDEVRLKTGEKVMIVAVVNSDTVRVARTGAASTDAPAPITNIASGVK